MDLGSKFGGPGIQQIDQIECDWAPFLLRDLATFSSGDAWDFEDIKMQNRGAGAALEFMRAQSWSATPTLPTPTAEGG